MSTIVWLYLVGVCGVAVWAMSWDAPDYSVGARLAAAFLWPIITAMWIVENARGIWRDLRGR